MASHPRVAAFLCHAGDDTAVTSDTDSIFSRSPGDVDTVRRGRSGSYPTSFRGGGPSRHDKIAVIRRFNGNALIQPRLLSKVVRRARRDDQKDQRTRQH